MKRCKCWRCEDHKKCDVNKMTRGEIEKLPCVKYGMEVIGQSFEKASDHIMEVSDEQREAD